MSTTYQYPPPGQPLPPPKKKRHVLRTIVLTLAGLILLIAVVSALSGGGDTPTQTLPSHQDVATGNQSPPQPQPPTVGTMTDGGWTLSDVQVTDNQFGDMLTARITNDEDEVRSGYFTVTAFDPANGHRVGTFTGGVSDVEPGTAATLTLIGPGQQQIPAALVYELDTAF